MAEVKYNTLLYEKDKKVPHILFITLNRPQKNNAISIGPDEITGEIQDAIRRADLDDEVKVVVFRAAGKSFSAGFDLSMVYRVYGGAPGVRPPQGTRLKVDEEQLFGMPRAVLGCKKVTIAQVQGWCIEAGMYISESCDIAIAARNAKFAHRGQRLAFGGIPYMPLEVLGGHNKKITELLITGRTISGAEAEEMGIVTRAVAPEDLEKEVYALAKAICLLPSDAIAIGKMSRKHIYESRGLTSVKDMVVYHTLGTNLSYTAEEREGAVFIRDRERVGEREAFHKLHEAMEQALSETKYFKSYTGD